MLAFDCNVTGVTGTGRRPGRHVAAPKRLDLLFTLISGG
jgi:hypothetical protein